ncbi:MAG: DEAD/DEAH box helicase family protein [Gammaproteobacteria bacterium]
MRIKWPPAKPYLEEGIGSINYALLPQVWHIPHLARFSRRKTLHEYQQDALKKAAKFLHCYFGDEHDWHKGETVEEKMLRKKSMAVKFYQAAKLERFTIYALEERSIKKNPVYEIHKSVGVEDDQPNMISYTRQINRACFWMATGSGKTLIMLKIVEFLEHLKKHGEIPPHNILILAPSDHLLRQIRRAVDDFNSGDGLQVELSHLRRFGNDDILPFGNTARVFYCRSDHLSEDEKKELLDWRRYENEGRWYVLLDEAHKGGREDSKRKAYFSLMAREGFLFNFSATFTDDDDIITTVAKYNLANFIANGHGKHIVMSEDIWRVKEEEKRQLQKKIMIKSLLTLAVARRIAEKLRQAPGCEKMYHHPLMLTLVNSVAVDKETQRNDLWQFFDVLRSIAADELGGDEFSAAKDGVEADWEKAHRFFEAEAGMKEAISTILKPMSLRQFRDAIFGSQTKGALEYILSSRGDKEIAFKLKNTDKPFGLIKIGTIDKWKNDFLRGMEQNKNLGDKSFFDNLDHSPSISILMGSRSFFESWDSTRPNVINFINIGKEKDAKKFIMQSVGRGVRIEPLPEYRRRFDLILGDQKPPLSDELAKKIPVLETLFLYATNREAINFVMNGLEDEKDYPYLPVTGFAKAERPMIDDTEMPLLVPHYRELSNISERKKFRIADSDEKRFTHYLRAVSDSLLIVSGGLLPQQIKALRQFNAHVQVRADKKYYNLGFLQDEFLRYVEAKVQEVDGVCEIRDDDIVHFRKITAKLPERDLVKLNSIVADVAAAKHGQSEDQLLDQLLAGKITKDEFKQTKKNSDSYRELEIKHCARHYYVPIVFGETTDDFIRHVITVKSEVKFLQALEKWLQENTPKWDAWMFSKLSEQLDGVYIPYSDGDDMPAKFRPDFVFWMCRGKKYRIFFVDPKSTAFTAEIRKLQGYKKLFMDNEQYRQFQHDSWKEIEVMLAFYNLQGDDTGFEGFVMDDIADIFAD